MALGCDSGMEIAYKNSNVLKSTQILPPSPSEVLYGNKFLFEFFSVTVECFHHNLSQSQSVTSTAVFLLYSYPVSTPTSWPDLREGKEKGRESGESETIINKELLDYWIIWVECMVPSPPRNISPIKKQYLSIEIGH